VGGRQGGSSSSSNSTSRAVPMDHILVDWRGDEGRSNTYSHHRRGHQPQEEGGRIVEILAAERKPPSNSRGGRKGGGRGRGKGASPGCN